MSLLTFIETTPIPPTNGSGELVQLTTVLIWPVVLSIFLLTQRKVLGRLFSALALLAESANKIKLWQIEVERTIDHEVDQAAKAAQGRLNTQPDISKTDVIAATRVENLVERLPESPSRDDVLNSVRRRMLALADEYDRTRASLPPGKERTIAMNGTAAQMRALGIVAKPGLKEFSQNRKSAGVRLCAVAILQMAPNSRYIDWLGERFIHEQPFVFYQAAIALMEAARRLDERHHPKLKAIIEAALKQLKSFALGAPDQNSINVLAAALRQIDEADPLPFTQQVL